MQFKVEKLECVAAPESVAYYIGYVCGAIVGLLY